MRFALAFLFATPALAGGPMDLTDIPLEEWQALARGKTLTYMVGDHVFALERYDREGPGVMLQLSDGTCLSGTWDHNETTYCFYWDANDPACFRHMALGEEIFIFQVENGVETGDVQRMTQISDAPLICDGLIS